MPRGDPPADLLKRNAEEFGCCPAADEAGVRGVRPRRCLPAAVREEIGGQASWGRRSRGRTGCSGAEPCVERRVRQAVPPVSLLLERLGT